MINRTHKEHLLEREITLADLLKSNGYATAHFGKWHLGMPSKERDKPTPDKHGFDYWFGTINGTHPNHKNPVNFLRNGAPVGKLEGYACQLLVDDAISWLDEKRDPDARFFSTSGSTSLMPRLRRRTALFLCTASWTIRPRSIRARSTTRTGPSCVCLKSWKKSISRRIR